MVGTLEFDSNKFSESTSEQQNSVNGGDGLVAAILFFAVTTVAEGILKYSTGKGYSDYVCEGIEAVADSLNNEDYCDDWWQNQFDCECSQCA